MATMSARLPTAMIRSVRIAAAPFGGPVSALSTNQPSGHGSASLVTTCSTASSEPSEQRRPVPANVRAPAAAGRLGGLGGGDAIRLCGRHCSGHWEKGLSRRVGR